MITFPRRIAPADKRLLRATPKQINRKHIVPVNTYNSWDGAEFDADRIEFGKAMVEYLAKLKKKQWTPGEVVDVLIGLGYRKPRTRAVHNAHRFELWVHELAAALAQFKRRKRRLFPTFGEVLEVALGIGFRKPSRADR